MKLPNPRLGEVRIYTINTDIEYLDELAGQVILTQPKVLHIGKTRISADSGANVTGELFLSRASNRRDIACLLQIPRDQIIHYGDSISLTVNGGLLDVYSLERDRFDEKDKFKREGFLRILRRHIYSSE